MVQIHEHTIEDRTWYFIEVVFPNFEVTLLNYGAAIFDVRTPDKDGTLETVVIQYEQISDYINNMRHLNATIGPTAGRIANGQFELNGVTYQLDQNYEEKHNLHGGRNALSYTLFDYQVLEEEDRVEVAFTTYVASSASQYPGSQQYAIIYTITPGDIHIELVADTDQTTLVNLTNHAYFNLSGNMKRNIFDQTVQLRASNRLLLDDEMIPLHPVPTKDTTHDFRTLRPIKQGKLVEIDEPFLLDEVSINQVQARLVDPESGRQLEVYTTYPSIVVYTDNFPMPYDLAYNARNEQYMGICFECQNPPNGIHLEDMESSILTPNERYYHEIRFVFSVLE